MWLVKALLASVLSLGALILGLLGACISVIGNSSEDAKQIWILEFVVIFSLVLVACWIFHDLFQEAKGTGRNARGSRN